MHTNARELRGSRETQRAHARASCAAPRLHTHHVRQHKHTGSQTHSPESAVHTVHTVQPDTTHPSPPFLAQCIGAAFLRSTPQKRAADGDDAKQPLSQEQQPPPLASERADRRERPHAAAALPCADPVSGSR